MNDTTIALGLLLVVLVVAALASRRVAIVTSLVAFACFDFFFLPPEGTFTIAKQDDWVALLALLAVSLIGSHLAYQARRRAEQAIAMAQARNEAEIARRSAETKSALVASLSHDLKSPLTALRVAAGNLRSSELSDDEHRDQIALIEAELARLKRLFDNIADLASVETRTVSPEPEWVHPNEVVDAACHQLASLLSTREITVVGGTEQLVRLDPRLTSAALSHVLENAIAYSPPTSPITVEVATAADRLTIAVHDRGQGLPSPPERVFERFYAAAGSRERFGRGMGLAIARGLLDVQGGRITASSPQDGGAVFTIEVPVATRDATEMTVDVA
jgi:two-component system sensor histidine kinase KdpD